MASGSTTRVCPACGAKNSDLSLFCAECGTALNGGSWQDDDQTQAFQPAATSGNRWTANTSSENTGTHDTTEPRYEPPARTDTIAQEAPSFAPITSSYVNDDAVQGGTGTVNAWSDWQSNDDRGVRGFVLGSLAWIIILAVFVLFLWVSVMSRDFKQDVRDLVPGLSTILLRY
jgi:hypothetical protein